MNDLHEKATQRQLADRERAALQSLEGWMRAFINFPAPPNLDGVVEKMRQYQSAWMDGRERPDPSDSGQSTHKGKNDG